LQYPKYHLFTQQLFREICSRARAYWAEVALVCTVFAKNKTALLLGHLVQGKLGDAAFGGGVMNLEVLGLHVFQPKRLGRPSLVEHNERRILVVEVHAVLDAAFFFARCFGDGCEGRDEFRFTAWGDVDEGEDCEGNWVVLI
jgi:hypothetical protein